GGPEVVVRILSGDRNVREVAVAGDDRVVGVLAGDGGSAAGGIDPGLAHFQQVVAVIPADIGGVEVVAGNARRPLVVHDHHILDRLVAAGRGDVVGPGDRRAGGHDQAGGAVIV